MGRHAITIRVNSKQLEFLKAAADTVDVPLKELVFRGAIGEAMDIRERLIKAIKEKQVAQESNGVVPELESQAVQSNPVDEEPQSPSDTGTNSLA